MAKVGLLNFATTALPFTMPELLEALTEYVALLGPVWGLDVELALLEDTPSASSGIWPLFLADRSNEPEAVAYHTLASTGQPWGVVFVQTALEHGEEPSVAVSHELAEMLVDPTCQSIVAGYAGEICDPVQGTHFLSRHDLALANFVYPRWFGLCNRGEARCFDQLQLCTQAFQIMPGGYASIWQERQGWTNLLRDAPASASLTHKLGTAASRLSRRQTITP